MNYDLLLCTWAFREELFFTVRCVRRIPFVCLRCLSPFNKEMHNSLISLFPIYVYLDCVRVCVCVASSYTYNTHTHNNFLRTEISYLFCLFTFFCLFFGCVILWNVH